MGGAKIKITSSELIAQSDKLSEISDAYKNSMKQVETILNSVNSNWSKNIANSFSVKISQTTSIFSSLTNLIDNSVKAAINAAEGYTTIDKQLEKIINGETKIANANGKQTIVTMESLLEQYKGKSIIEVLKMLDDSYDNLPKEYRDFIDMISKEVFGSKATKISKLLLNAVSGDLKAKDIWTVIDIAGSALTKGSPTAFGLSPFGIIFTTAKTIVSNKYYWTSTDKYTDEAVERFKEGNIIGGVASIALSTTELGKGLTDVACHLIDNTFKLSEISTAVKLMYGVDLSAGFNTFSSGVNKGVDTAIGYVSDGFEAVGSAVTSGVKAVGSFIKGLFW